MIRTRCRVIGDEPRFLLFFQLGRFMECNDVVTRAWVERLGPKPMGWNRRGAGYGFPFLRANQFLSALPADGLKVTVIR